MKKIFLPPPIMSLKKMFREDIFSGYHKKNKFVKKILMKIPVHIFLFFFFMELFSCHEQVRKQAEKPQEFKHAKGFSIQEMEGYKKLTLLGSSKDSNEKFEYFLVPKKNKIPQQLIHKQLIRTPIERIVLTSTSHVPILELLEEENSLVGFPNTAFISSPKTRKRVIKNQVHELGSAQALNTEVLLALAPDLVVGFSVGRPDSSFSNLQKRGIPVMLNRDWLEETPLGRAEWIRLFGALYEKEHEAATIFKEIEREYLKIQNAAHKAISKPTVLSGSLFQDVWYLPAGDSFNAQLFKDAHTDYLWKDSKGKGSLGLNFENVFEKAQNADLWIGCDAFANRMELESATEHYKQFKAFINNKIYSYAHLKGATGGLLYFELAPVQPHILLKDIVKIAHPELLPGYHPYFFRELP
jgi:iron complex transport system substrate-binding protein